jgi:integrase/recombinase XerD
MTRGTPTGNTTGSTTVTPAGISARVDPAADRLAFERLVETWLRVHPSANTRSAYGSDIAGFGRWCAGSGAVPLQVTAADVAMYQTACELSGDSASTIRRRSSALSSFFDFAVERAAVTENPVTGTARPQVTAGDPSSTRQLDLGAVEGSLAAAREIDPRLHALVALLALDGLKLNEALALDVTDISGRGSNVSAAVARPSGRRRLVLHREGASAVRRCAAGRADGPLFVSGRPSVRGSVATRLTRFGADHLIKRLPHVDGTPLTANSLRRFYVSSSHAAGVDLDEIRDRAGLGDVRTARRYLPSHHQHQHNHQPGDLGSGRRATPKEV